MNTIALDKNTPGAFDPRIFDELFPNMDDGKIKRTDLFRRQIFSWAQRLATPQLFPTVVRSL